MNRQELANKIDHEGGLDSALHWGLRATDIDPEDEELIPYWEKLQSAWKLFCEMEDQVMEKLPDPDNGW